MNCLQFSEWLENRDVYDVSEADKALKHADVCEECEAKLVFDEQLDGFLYSAMKPVDMPVGLIDRVDLSLDRVKDPSPSSKFRIFSAFSAVAALLVVFAITFTLTQEAAIPTMDALGRYVVADDSHHGDAALAVRDPNDSEVLGDFQLSYADLMSELPDSYTFVGSRICPLGDCQSVHLVFLDKGKRVSVYLVRKKDVGFSLASGKKYTVSSEQQVVSFWKKGDFVIARIG